MPQNEAGGHESCFEVEIQSFTSTPGSLSVTIRTSLVYFGFTKDQEVKDWNAEPLDGEKAPRTNPFHLHGACFLTAEGFFCALRTKRDRNHGRSPQLRP